MPDGFATPRRPSPPTPVTVPQVGALPTPASVSLRMGSLIKKRRKRMRKKKHKKMLRRTRHQRRK